MIEISGSLIWSKTPMELIFNPVMNFGEVWRSQLAKSTLLASMWDLLRSVQMLKRVWGTESNRKPLHLFIPGKTEALVPAFVVEDLLLAELQLWFLRLQ